MSKQWKKARGKLGFLAPLLGRWVADAQTPMGPVHCTRAFEKFGSSYVRLDARWEFARGIYHEIALIGIGDDGKAAFWSFTSDGKRSEGTVADVTDIHPEAVGFEAQMPGDSHAWPTGPMANRGSSGSSNRKPRRAGIASRSITTDLLLDRR